MTTASTNDALVGAWRAQLTFTDGPRHGECEPVRLTFLPGGVVVHADEVPAENGQLPRGIGEWISQDDHFSYWFNVVLNDPTGRPAVVVYVSGKGRLGADRRSLVASGGSEVYGSTGELLATNRAELHATRVEDPRTERDPTTNISDPYDSTSDQDSPLDQVGTTLLFENDRVRVWEMTLDPGETCDSHGHRHDYLMIYPDAALGRSSSRSRLERVDAGLVAFATVGAEGLPPHQITNAGERRSTHYIVELLGPSAAATAQPLAHNGRVRVEHDPGRPTTREPQPDTTATSTGHSSTTDSHRRAWERWWSEVTGAAGEVVWAADEADLAADLEVLTGAFDRTLPVVDLGCGDGRQTRFLAQHFETVIGVDVSAAAVERARGGENSSNVRYRVLDAGSPGQAEQLHEELGDANVYVRGVLQALPAADRPQAVRSIGALLGDRGALFAKELPPQAGAYFAQAVERHGMWPELERVMRLIPPGQITEEELVDLFPRDRFEVISAGAGRIDTVNALPDGEPIQVPAIYVLARPRRFSSRADVEAGGRAVGDDPDLDALKQGARLVWAAGDYPAIARVIAEAGGATALRAGAAPGVRLLDVACGDGNVAIPAARAGAAVTGLDLTPELLDAGRVRAAAQRVDISWVLGDAEELPFGEASFDAVTSNFGAVFAPRHAVVARELARVCRPGGMMVITAWAPDGFNERVMEIGRSYLPQPPVPEPPVLWADPAHARACFQSTDVELSFERDSIRARVASVQALVELIARSFGPLVLARERLTQEGRWEELLLAITAECDRWGKPVADGIQIDMDYVVITGRKHISQPSRGQM